MVKLQLEHDIDTTGDVRSGSPELLCRRRHHGLRTASSTSRFIMDEITKAVLIGAAAMMKIMTGPLQCIPGADVVTQTIMDAAQAAASAIVGHIPSLDLDLGLPSIQLLPPEKLFCKEVYKTPGFASAPCAAELGSTWGRDPAARASHESRHEDSRICLKSKGPLGSMPVTLKEGSSHLRSFVFASCAFF